MRVLLQRVLQAGVTVDGERIARIGPGLLAFVGVFPDDDAQRIKWLADKTLGLRIFPAPAEREEGTEGTMDASVVEVAGELLVVSQFTLAAETNRGRRPGFSTAAKPELARRLFDDFVAAVSNRGVAVATGRFGANMQVDLVNDGPATFLLEK